MRKELQRTGNLQPFKVTGMSEPLVYVLQASTFGYHPHLPSPIRTIIYIDQKVYDYDDVLYFA